MVLRYRISHDCIERQNRFEEPSLVLLFYVLHFMPLNGQALLSILESLLFNV